MNPFRTFRAGIEQEIFINKRNEKRERGFESTKGEYLLEIASKLTGQRLEMLNDCDGKGIWTPQGLFYVYRYTPEISSYPVPAREGCVEDLISSIKAGRNLMLDIGREAYGDDAIVKGWSMHYNIGSSSYMDAERVKVIQPLLAFFFAHPWSRSETHAWQKTSSKLKRVEIICDYMSDLDQVEAGLALALAAVHGKNASHLPVTSCANTSVKSAGRQAEIQAEGVSYSLEEFMDHVFEILRDDVERFGGNHSAQLIESYLKGERRTSIDSPPAPIFRDEIDTIGATGKDWKVYDAHRDLYMVRPEKIDKFPLVMRRMEPLFRRGSLRNLSWKGYRRRWRLGTFKY